MATPAGQHETYRGRVDQTAVSEARKTSAIGSQLERRALFSDPVTTRTFVPFGEADSGCRRPGTDQSRTRKIFLYGAQTKMADPQHRLKTRFADGQGWQACGPFPILKPHGHERALFQIDDGADPETETSCDRRTLPSGSTPSVGPAGEGVADLLRPPCQSLPVRRRAKAVDGSTSRIELGVGQAERPGLCPSSAEVIRCGRVLPNGALLSQ